MVTPSSVLRGLAALALFASASALRPPTRLRPTMSAAVLPTAYRALAAGCAWRATSSDPASAAVLLSTAVAAAADLGPGAAAQLATAKRAQSSGATAVGADAADAWRSVVRLKLLGQLAGLAASALCGAALAGAASVVAADAAFWALGGGAKRLESDGSGDGVRAAPIPSPLARALLSVNLVLLASTLAAAAARRGAMVRTAGAAVYCAGMLAQTIGDEKTRRRKALAAAQADVASPA